MFLRQAVFVTWVLLSCSVVAAQGEGSAPAGSSSAVLGWYVIRPGDTIEGLTTRYLGTRERWEENWKLNQGLIEDADRIVPGQHIRLLLPEKLPDGALLTKFSNRVEDQPTPLEWIAAHENEVLRSRDGIKTFENASARLDFPDGTFLILTEESLVFLGGEAPAATVDRTQIEVVVGHADLSAGAAEGAREQFEIVLGDAKATPRAGKDGRLETRARRLEGGGAQLMVYRGESDLEAAGGKVKVAEGMGSSVPEGEPPEPPEQLLPAATGLRPTARARLATPRPTFSWQPVPGARDYTLEICRDKSCGALVERVEGVAEPTWQSEGLAVDSFYWRVTAVSESGLDGYPSGDRSFEILSAVEDTAPPEIGIAFTGPGQAPRSGLNDRWIVGPGMAIEVEVEDDGSGVEGWQASLDGEEISREGLKGPWERGAHTVAVKATDRAGNEREVEVPFVFDPDAPELSWGVEGDPRPLGSTGGEPGEALDAPAPSLRGRRELRSGQHLWFLDSDLAHVVLRPLSGKPIGLEGLGALGREAGLWVRAEDAVCELDKLTYDLVPGSGKGEVVLWIEATDCVGNTRRGQLPLVRQKR